MNQLQPFSGFVSLICRLNSLEKRDGLAWLVAPASASLGERKVSAMDWTGERNGERICSGGKSGYRYQKNGE